MRKQREGGDESGGAAGCWGAVQRLPRARRNAIGAVPTENPVRDSRQPSQASQSLTGLHSVRAAAVRMLRNIQ